MRAQLEPGRTFKWAGERKSLCAAIEHVSVLWQRVASSGQSEEQLCRGSPLQRHADDQISQVWAVTILCPLHWGLQAFHRPQKAQL